MAPNRKNVNTLIESLSSNDLQSLQNTIQPKYLPLTQAQTEEKSEPVGQKSEESASYWDWPAESQDVNVEVLSLANIESKLIEASSTSAESSEQVAAHDEYWADQSESSTPVVRMNKPQHAASPYWEWPAEQDAKQATIDRIVAEEKAYQIVSGKTAEMIEQATQSQSEPQQVERVKAANDGYWEWSSLEVAAYTMDESHPNRNYWDWDSSEKKQPEHPFKALLEYEAARQMLTADNIVCQLQSQKAASEECTRSSSDNYWSWSEGYGDNYWQDEVQPVVAVTSTGAGYWDW